jgi:hypothetical protein
MNSLEQNIECIYTVLYAPTGLEERFKHVVAVPTYPNPDPSHDVRTLSFEHSTLRYVLYMYSTCTLLW